MSTNGDDFILTLDSEPEDDFSKPGPSKRTKKKSAPTPSKQAEPVADEAALNPDFNFNLNEGSGNVWDNDDESEAEEAGGDKPKPITVDDIIERRKRHIESSQKRKGGVSDEEEVVDDDDSGSEDERVDLENMSAVESDEDDSEEEDGLQIDGHSDDESENAGSESEGSREDLEMEDDESSSDESEEETAAQKERKAAFFAPETAPGEDNEAKTFLGLNLSRPLLRAIQAMNYTKPTPIQMKAIPMAMQGLDVLGSAVTGSGKTAAFMIPILERLMFKDRTSSGEIRVLILTPTRELAVQCAEVGQNLARFMDISFAVLVGGMPLKTQEHLLRGRPDIVIATPGRLIDHIQNTPSFTLAALDILVLDEADRMLAEGFAAELQEVIQSCPQSRQTMLFSATMTDDVDSLVRLSMNRPVRLFVDPKKTVAKALVQEFVRVRKESDRQSILATVCKRAAKARTIIFFRSKLLCHQMKVVFGLLGLKTAELHANLTQQMRLDSLKQFRDGEVNYLLATDVASRGLDIKGVETVINYDMPGQIELYLHRVGRTARAGRKGRAITLVGEPDRKMLKAVMKRSPADKVKHRILPPDSLKAMAEKLKCLKPEVAAVLEEEREEKEIRTGEMKIEKVQNMIEHREEILARPKRTWFQSERQKTDSKAVADDEYSGQFTSQNAEGVENKKRKREQSLNHQAKRRKVAREDFEEDKGRAAAQARNIRMAKKARRPQKITWAPPERSLSAPTGKKTLGQSKTRKSRPKVKKAGFDSELGNRRSNTSAREGTRSQRGDNVPLRDKRSRTSSGKGSTKGAVMKKRSGAYKPKRR